MTREQKLATFQELSKLDGVQTGTCFADSYNTARTLIGHPHAYREWKILGPDSIPGFYHLESRVRLDQYEITTHHLCLHESQFERIS